MKWKPFQKTKQFTIIPPSPKKSRYIKCAHVSFSEMKLKEAIQLSVKLFSKI